ncbi:MAG: PPOX class F420-dependent oxidoreductase [Actinomycetota bacterium]|nr:PPOX class F420-dependent oxidoreductase [Actinomycetota bacterium]
MASLSDSEVRALLEPANYAVVSTLNSDGSVLSAVAWISLEGDELAVNSARGRQWPTNLERDARITVLVFPADNPYEYVEVRGTAAGSRDDADDHINRLAKKYINQDEYPFRQPGEDRIKYVISPERVRHQKQG